MANDLIQRKYYIVDTEDSLPSEIVDGSIYYVKSNNALYIDMSSTRRRINPDYSNKLDANQGYINAGKSLSIDDNGNIIPVENINIDPTLKNQGQAADAKITGQALGELYDYFEGLQQIIENLDDSTAVSTDTTLSNQGVPADAKATGDRLASMQSELNVLEPTATASDIGKTLKVKTVANGKVSKYELGDMMIDNTLTQTGWAADAKKVGNELSSVKDEVRNESQARTTADNALREDINDDLAQIQAQISSVYGAPSTASTVAQMTDHTKAYVYTGEESGYVTGNWYYWNGSSWVSGGVYNAVAVQTDKSLTLDGKAADAKTVGDELSGLKDDLNANTEVDLKTVELTAKPILTTNDGYGIRTTGAGAADYASCKIQRYTVTPGELLFLKIAASESPATYVFKSSDFAVVTNNVGLVHTEPVDKFVLVPDGATHLFVSFAMTDTTSNVYTVKSIIDTLKMDSFNKDAKIALLACLEHVAWIDGNGKTYYDTLKSYLIDEEEPIIIEPIIPTFNIGGTLSTNKQLGYTKASTRVVHNPIAYKLAPGTYDIEVNYTGDYYYSVLLFNYDEEEYPDVDFAFTQGANKTFIPEQKTTQYWSFSSWSKVTKTITVTEDYPFLNFQFKNGSAGTTNFTQSDVDLIQNNVVIRYKGE